MIFYIVLFLIFLTLIIISHWVNAWDTKDKLKAIGICGIVCTFFLAFLIGFVGGSLLPDRAFTMIEKESHALLPLDEICYLQYATNENENKVLLGRYTDGYVPIYKVFHTDSNEVIITIMPLDKENPYFTVYTYKLKTPWSFFFVDWAKMNTITIYADSTQISFITAIIYS